MGPTKEKEFFDWLTGKSDKFPFFRPEEKPVIPQVEGIDEVEEAHKEMEMDEINYKSEK